MSNNNKIDYTSLIAKIPNRYMLAHVLGDMYSKAMHKNFLKEIYENPHTTMERVFDDFISDKKDDNEQPIEIPVLEADLEDKADDDDDLLDSEIIVDLPDEGKDEESNGEFNTDSDSDD